MSQTVFALKGTLGTTDYYVVTMKGNEVVSKIRVPKEIEGWENLDIEERYQREINDARVKKFIAPYFANDPDRFFGSLLVCMQNFEGVVFEQLENVATKLPVAYKTPATNAGFLTLTGSEIMFPIDGQHRLRALKYAIDGKDGKGEDIDGLSSCQKLAQEDVVVVLFNFESEKARKIFSKVNRYAKPTSKAQNLITDDDDVFAVITRQIASTLIPARLVNTSSNTLTDRSYHFTTLATLYECVKYIIESIHGKTNNLDTSEKEQKLYEKGVNDVWKELIEKVNHFQEGLSNPEENGDQNRRDLRKETLLAKPVTQLCLVRAYMNLTEKSQKMDGSVISSGQVIDRLNKIKWRLDEQGWQRIIMNGTKIMSGQAVIKRTTDFIIYATGFMPKSEQETLLEKYIDQFPVNERGAIKKLPKLSHN